MGKLVLIIGQGRSGSTLILRLLNRAPGVRVCGENYRAMDGLRAVYESFTKARGELRDDFCRHAWMPPCGTDELLDHCRAFFRAVYNPGGAFRAYGFKEIRYGYGTYEELEAELGFYRLLFPDALFVFSTRDTDTAVKSSWWADDPVASAATLTHMRANFERYLAEHPEGSFHLPYEGLKRGSPALPALFGAVGLDYLPGYEAELDVVIR